MSVNSFMYADDLILLSLSVIDLQKMIDFCSFELGRIKLNNINSSKSVCLRIVKVRYAGYILLRNLANCVNKKSVNLLFSYFF